MKCDKSPWWRLNLHKWTYGVSTFKRAQDGIDRVFMGHFLRRETRTCTQCWHRECLDVFGGEYKPWGWIDERHAPNGPRITGS